MKINSFPPASDSHLVYAISNQNFLFVGATKHSVNYVNSSWMRVYIFVSVYSEYTSAAFRHHSSSILTIRSTKLLKIYSFWFVICTEGHLRLPHETIGPTDPSKCPFTNEQNCFKDILMTPVWLWVFISFPSFGFYYRKTYNNNHHPFFNLYRTGTELMVYPAIIPCCMPDIKVNLSSQSKPRTRFGDDVSCLCLNVGRFRLIIQGFLVFFPIFI